MSNINNVVDIWCSTSITTICCVLLYYKLESLRLICRLVSWNFSLAASAWPMYFIKMDEWWTPNRVFGKTEDYGFLSLKKSEDIIFDWVKKLRLKISLKFLHVKTEEWRPAQSGKIKCEDCILKCEDPKINSCWLDSHNPTLWFMLGFC